MAASFCPSTDAINWGFAYALPDSLHRGLSANAQAIISSVLQSVRIAISIVPRIKR
jgi:hypothetical protein